MKSSTLHQLNTFKQDAQEGIFTMQGLALTHLVQNLIREHGHYHSGSYVVDINDLTINDKRLLLSHFESAEWYAYACESATNTEVLFDEGKKYYQRLLDDESYNVYVEDIEEMRDYR
jgi:hypothetical protein